MFELRVQVDFAAAHHLTGYPGDCARPHGHNWVLEVFARSKQLDSIGMAVDFRTLKTAARELVAPWDHQDLNTLEDFKSLPTSAEQLAQLAYERLSQVFASPSGQEALTWIDRVTIWENPRCSATYWPDRPIVPHS